MPEVISLRTLIAVHLHTHSCTANHAMRSKYRSAVYVFDAGQACLAASAISDLQEEFDQPIITKVLPFKVFKLNKAGYLNYYYANPQKPFCENIVNPKLRLLIQRFADQVDQDKLPVS
jgi:peptide-methionine (S)-S-oxide reductase